MLLTALDTLDAVLERHADALGTDLVPYRHHAYRVVNFCAALSAQGSRTEPRVSTPQPDALQKITIAVAFHDLGIWTDQTFDYLGPSERLAMVQLAQSGRADWSLEISEMILQHHKLRRYRAHDNWLVEPFRRADLIDVTQGVIRFGLPREFIRDLYELWPTEGFHRRLVDFELERLRTHPWSPLPMLRF